MTAEGLDPRPRAEWRSDGNVMRRHGATATASRLDRSWPEHHIT